MAGYMTKLQGYVYEGELPNATGAAVQNGMFVKIGTGANAGKFVLAADANTKLLCKEVTTIYDGIPAYRFIVVALGTTPTYFVENGFEVNDAEAYDTTLYETANGKLLRAHPLLVGEELITDKVSGTIAAGTQYAVLATGLIG